MELSPLIISIITFSIVSALVLIISVSVTVQLTKNAEYMRDALFNEVDPESISMFLKNLTVKPHIAGTHQDEVVLADYIADHFRENLDEVEIYEHKLTLSYTRNGPKDEEHLPNSVDIWNEISNTTDFECSLTERDMPGDGYDTENDEVADLWLAFSPAGEVKGQPLYVNFGRDSDYLELCKSSKETASLPNLCDANNRFLVKNYICIMRYGKIFRGNKVANAEKFGCKGAVLYNDPEQYAREGEDRNVYKEGVYLPSEGGQRGTSLLSDGDPETPGYPADNDGIYYRNTDRAKDLKTDIIAQQISYKDAKEIMKLMDKNQNYIADNKDWKGGLTGIDYVTGPGFDTAHINSEIRVISHNYEETKTVRTICGYLWGSREPDRYVIYGNHRDAWGYGAIDPNSGTASLMEVVKAYGYVVREENYRPVRTLMFCSLAAEEYGLFGSYELMEQIGRYLDKRAVVYLNVDSSVNGNTTFTARGSPHLRKVVEDSAKIVANPNPEQQAYKTLYDNWIDTNFDVDRNRADPGAEKVGWFPPLGSGSDFRPFLQLGGIASIDFRYKDYNTGYPLYHSMYETHFAVANIVDQGFLCHKSMTQIWIETGRHFADDLILPFDLRNYGQQIKQDQNNIQLQKIQKYERDYDLNMKHLKNLTDTLVLAFDNFQDKVDKVKENRFDKDYFQHRKINDVLMNVERMFLYDHGLLGREFEDKHLIYATSQYDTYQTSLFPTLDDYDMQYYIEPGTTVKQNMQIQFSLICAAIEEAIYTLNQAGQRIFQD